MQSSCRWWPTTGSRPNSMGARHQVERWEAALERIGLIGKEGDD
jgi:hypothetical protein